MAKLNFDVYQGIQKKLIGHQIVYYHIMQLERQDQGSVVSNWTVASGLVLEFAVSEKGLLRAPHYTF